MSTLSQRIATLKKQRGEKLSAYEAVLQKAVAEDRDVSDDEQTALDAVKEDVDGLDNQISRLEDSEKIIARAAVPVIPVREEREANGGGHFDRVPARPMDSRATQEWIRACRMDDYPAAGFTRMAIAMALAGPFNAHHYALQRWGSKDFADVVQRIGFGLGRAATDPMSTDEAPGSAGGAGSLQPIVHVGSEFIELLRAQLIVGRLPRVRRLSFGGAGTLLIPKQTGGVAGGYVGEGSSISVQRLNFNQLRLTPSKLAVIVPTTNELLRRSDPATEQLIRDDLLEGTARTMDSTFLSTAAASAAAPAGILNGIAENAGGQIHAAATVTEIATAMKAMISALRNANIPMIAPAWIMNPRLKEFLRLFVTDLGVFPWKAEIDQGVLLGYPIIDSTTVPLNWNAVAGDSIWVLLDCSQLLFAEDLMPTVDASEEASIQADTTPQTPPGGGTSTPLAAPTGGGIVSAFQQDMLFMRLRSSHTWNRRYDTGLTWATEQA